MPDTQFSIQIPNLQQIIASFTQAPSIVAPRISDAINKALAILAKNGDDSTFQFKTPRELRTGYLSASWGAPSNGLSLASPGNLSGKIWTNAGYAIYVHQGTAPHVIMVKTKKVLANVKTGQVFGKQVNHPGTAPNPFIPRIINKSQSDINAGFKVALDYIVQDMAAKSQ